MKTKIKQTTKLLKALADEKRLQIINLLSADKMCVCKITESLDLSQPNISHHLKVLKEAELIKSTKRGKWVDYELNKAKLQQVEDNLELLITN